MKMKCSKCGEETFGVFHAEQKDAAHCAMMLSVHPPFGKLSAEHLHFYCRCGFDWTHAVLAQIPADPEVRP